MYKIGKNKKLAKLVTASFALNALGGMALPMTTSANSVISESYSAKLDIIQANDIKDDVQFLNKVAAICTQNGKNGAEFYKEMVDDAKAHAEWAEDNGVVIDSETSAVLAVDERIRRIAKSVADAGTINIGSSTNPIATTAAEPKGASTVKNGDGGSTFGTDAKAYGGGSTAVGTGSAATGDHSAAFGEGSTATGTNSTASGVASEATGGNSTATGAGSKAIGNNSTATGIASEATGEGATATGAGAFATGDHSTANGEGSTASGENSSAIGVGSAATGERATATGATSMAAGKGATANGAGSSAMGDHSSAFGEGSTATGGNSTATGTNAKATGESSVAVGDSAIATGEGSIAQGKEAAAFGAHSTAVGEYATATGNGSIAMGHGAVSTGNGSIALGAGSVATEDNVVSVGREGAERRITNIADGINNHDAVNMGQLRHVRSELQDNINAVGAQAAAMANLHPTTDGARFSVSAAVGGYKGTAAGAIGAYYHPTENSMITLSGSVVESGDVMYGIGYSQSIGSAAPHEDTTRDMLVSLSNRNTKLEQELGSVSAQNAQLQETLIALQEQVKALAANSGIHETTVNAIVPGLAG